MRQNHSTADKRLFDIAALQQGHFTAGQAQEAGFRKSNHLYHVKKNNWISVARGIYRLAKFPLSPDSEYAAWSLWSRNRAGEPQGVYSHETALAIYDLSDANPAKLHMTVPPAFRRHSKIPEILVLHKGVFSKADVQEREGYRVTRPVRTIRDLLFEDAISTDIIRQALEQGFKRGYLTRQDIAVLSKAFPGEKRLFKDLDAGPK